MHHSTSDFFVCLQVSLEVVSADAPAEEQNATETAKTYKVNCDKRNTTGMENFTVRVLNASQVNLLLPELISGSVHPLV